MKLLLPVPSLAGEPGRILVKLERKVTTVNQTRILRQRCGESSRADGLQPGKRISLNTKLSQRNKEIITGSVRTAYSQRHGYT